MIFKEYAIQPDVLNTKENCRFWLSLMGLEKGRQISRYPKRWKRLVFDSLINCKPREKKYIEERLFNLPNNVIKRIINDWDPDIEWLNNAIEQDTRNPFHAIIANEDPQEVEKVLIADEIDESHELLDVGPSTSIIRDLNGITEWITPLLEQGSLIVLIDPFFSPNSRDYLIVLKRFIEIINGSNSSGKTITIQYHSRESQGGIDDFFISVCEDRIRPMMVENLIIEFYRWPDNEIHNRFVLTDSHGGVSYGYGLAIGSPNHDEKDEINYLADNAYDQRWKKFAESSKQPICEIVL